MHTRQDQYVRETGEASQDDAVYGAYQPSHYAGTLDGSAHPSNAAGGHDYQEYCAQDISNPGPRHDREFNWGTWAAEIITLSLAVLLTATIIGILVWMDGEPYFETWRVPLSINTVLAILTAGLSAASLHAVSSAIGQLKWIEFKTRRRTLKMWEVYDGCSRGPMGALEALYWLPGSILLLGTLVTLGSVTIGTFTQQTVALVPRNVTIPDPGAAVIKLAMDYNTFPKQNGLGFWHNPDIASRDPGIRGAVMRGIFGNPTTPAFRCGGACTWPGTHQTMAFVSRCTNVTEETMRTKKCAKPASETGCNMTTPGGVKLSTRFVATDSATVLALNVTTNPDYMRSSEEVSASPELARLAVFRSTSGPDSHFNTPEILGEDVTECSIALVLREYKDIRTNGTTFSPESVTDRALGRGYWMRTPGFTDAGSNDSGNTSFNSAFSFNTTANGTALARNVSICQQDLANLFAYFTSPGFRSEVVSGNALTPESGGAVFAFIGTFKNGSTVYPDASPAVDSVGALVHSMTDAMSEYVRAGTPTSFEVSGSRVEQVVFVRVVWQWLALPVLLQVLSVVFLALVVWRNHCEGGGLPLWRSSATAMLLHSVDPADGMLRGPGNDTTGLSAMLKQRFVLESITK